MLLENLFENTNQGYENLRKLISAQNSRQPAEITVAGQPLTLEYPEVNFLVGQYKAFQRAGRLEQFIKDMDDPMRLDAHMKKLRDLIDKQKNFQGSVPGEREVAEASQIISMLESRLAEQDSMDPKVLGVSNLRMIEKTMNTAQPVTMTFSDGSTTVIDDPMEKKYFIAKMNAYNKKGMLAKYILDMGVSERFDFHVEQLANEYARLEMQKGVPPGGQEPPQQVQEIKKKTDKPEDIGSQDVVDPKLKAELIKARAENPAAASDLEAYLKSARTKFNRTSQDIDSVKDENQQQQELLDKLVNFDREQRQELQQLDQENDQQEQELDALQTRNRQLEKAVAAMAKTRQDMPTRKSAAQGKAQTKATAGQQTATPIPTAVPAMGTSSQGDISGVGLVGQQDLYTQPSSDQQVRDLFTQQGQGTTSVTKRRKEATPAANQSMNPNLFTQLPAAESRVRVNKGEFQGRFGVVENQTADGFVMVMLENFGRCTLHSSKLEKV